MSTTPEEKPSSSAPAEQTGQLPGGGDNIGGANPSVEKPAVPDEDQPSEDDWVGNDSTPNEKKQNGKTDQPAEENGESDKENQEDDQQGFSHPSEMHILPPLLVHPPSGFPFPPRVGGFMRKGVEQCDREGLDVGVYYELYPTVAMDVFVSPIPQEGTGSNLEGDFEIRKCEILSLQQHVEQISEEPVTVFQRAQKRAGKHATFTYTFHLPHEQQAKLRGVTPRTGSTTVFRLRHFNEVLAVGVHLVPFPIRELHGSPSAVSPSFRQHAGELKREVAKITDGVDWNHLAWRREARGSLVTAASIS